MRASPIFATIIVIGLGGCAIAPPPGPSVMALPAHGESFEAFQSVDTSCRQYAKQQTGIAPSDGASRSLAASAVIGTFVGAATGAAIGAATGNPAIGAAIGAGSGLVAGTLTGFGAAHASGQALQRRYDMSYIQCMTAKGENVPQSIAYAYPYTLPYSYPSYYPGY